MSRPTINEDIIKELTKTKGWLEVEKLLLWEMQKMRDVMDIDSDFTEEVKGRQASFKTLERFLKKMNLIKNKKEYIPKKQLI